MSSNGGDKTLLTRQMPRQSPTLRVVGLTTNSSLENRVAVKSGGYAGFTVAPSLQSLVTQYSETDVMAPRRHDVRKRVRKRFAGFKAGVELGHAHTAQLCRRMFHAVTRPSPVGTAYDDGRGLRRVRTVQSVG
jgi:hypothetical protein